MNHYVYRIDRPTTGEWYVGIRSCKCRPTEDVGYLGSGTRLNNTMRGRQSEFNKTILVIVQTRKEAARIEAALVGPAQVEERLCMNLCEGGDCGSVGYRHTAKSKAKIGAANQGRPVSNETRAKLSMAQTGCVLTDETRAKIGAANRGRVPAVSPDGRARIIAFHTGRVRTDETRARIKASWTPERRAAQADRMRHD